MKAIVSHRYGSPDVLRCEEVEAPTPGDGEVLIRVRAASVNPLDWHFLRGKPYVARLMFGLFKPNDTRPGRDVAGQVEAVGKGVTRFQPGDEVFGACRGAFAEMATAAEGKLARKPAGIPFEDAAALPVAGLTALQGLRDRAQVRTGQSVLVNGAAGGVGTLAVQIAKSFGTEVTAVCSTRNLELVRSLGADHAVDYTREDFTRSGRRYDLIFDCIGNHSLSACRRALHPAGRQLAVGAPPLRFLVRAIAALALSPFQSRKLVTMLARIDPQDLTLLGELVASGKVRAVIDRRYGLSEVPGAIRYLEAGHARGKVIITI